MTDKCTFSFRELKTPVESRTATKVAVEKVLKQLESKPDIPVSEPRGYQPDKEKPLL